MRWTFALVIALSGCAHAPGAAGGPAAGSSDGPAFGQHGRARPEAALADAPWLRERVLATPYTYFRFVNAAFVGEVCRRLGPLAERAQRLNLHGDAHVEQLAVTDEGRGLTDFDDSTRGPAAIDLVRFTASLWLVGDARGWQVDAAVDAFFAGYRAALADPALSAPEPAPMAALRAALHDDRPTYFARIAELMEPVEPALEARLRAALGGYVEGQRRTHPALAPGYFAVRALGRTRVGIGSARSNKYLVRVEGPTADADDDVVLEAKEVGLVPAGACVERTPAPNPLRPIVGQARIGYQPYAHTGYLVLDGVPYWVHAWARAYQELRASELASVDALAEVARDAGVQLGLGHPRYVDAPFEAETRARERSALDEVEPQARALGRALAAEVTASWRRARGESP